jgi:lipoprotein-anchoring transpeptidase ErfK/SrfK
MRLLPYGVAVLVILGGCGIAQVPYTQNHPESYQKVARSASHWDVLADDVSARTMAAIGNKKTIYVAAAAEATDFNRAFRNFLITRMVDKGIPVSAQKIGVIEVQYEAQVVRHNSERYAYKPGTITALTAGVLVAYDAQKWAKLDRVLALLGGATVADAVVSSDAGNPTKTELVVTTSALEGGRFLMRKTDIYYLEPEDVSLFMHVEKQSTPVREFNVVGAR